jgi:hypothetical protein
LGFVGPYDFTFGYSVMDVAQPSGMCVTTARLPAYALPIGLPSGYNYAWLVNPIHGNMCPAVVVSGSGASYTMAFHFGPPGGTPTDTQNVQILQFDHSQVLPVGTWVMAQRVNGTWYAQPPIWL